MHMYIYTGPNGPDLSRHAATLLTPYCPEQPRGRIAMFRDNRETVVQLSASELPTSDRDDYTTLQHSLQKIRRCSFCCERYTLLDLLTSSVNHNTRSMCTGNRRLRKTAHFDHDTEDVGDMPFITIPYRFYLCLVTDFGLRHPDRCTKFVRLLYDNTKPSAEWCDDTPCTNESDSEQRSALTKEPVMVCIRR